MSNAVLDIELDNDVDTSTKVGKKLMLFRSGTLKQGTAPLEGDEHDERKRHPFVVTITKDANMSTESVVIDWVATEPENADTIEIQIKNLYNFF